MSTTPRERATAFDLIFRTRLLSGALGASAIASFAIWKLGPFVWVWGGLTALSTVLNLWAAITGPAKSAAEHMDLAGEWNDLRWDLEKLWKKGLPADPYRDQLNQMLDRRKLIEKKEPPLDEKLLAQVEAGLRKQLTQPTPKRALPPGPSCGATAGSQIPHA